MTLGAADVQRLAVGIDDDADDVGGAGVASCGFGGQRCTVCVLGDRVSMDTINERPVVDEDEYFARP